MIDIDTGALAGLLQDRRWFGQKDKAVERVDILDAAIVGEDEPALVLALVEVRFADDTRAVYNVPLLHHADGGFADAAEHPERLGILGSLMAHADAVKGDSGIFEFNGAGLDPMAPPGGGSARLMGSEQSNTSLVLDESVVVKLFRKLEAGPNPDIELNRLLTGEGYEHTPPQLGEITYTGSLEGGDVTYDIAIAQSLAADAQDGWDHIVGTVRGVYHQALSSPSDDPVVMSRELSEATFSALGHLGEATAEMHVVLAREEADAAFAPEPITPDEIRELMAGAQARLTKLAGHIDALDALATKLSSRIDAFGELEMPGAKTRVHGDLHLGQVLWTPRGWMLLDFEGEPARPMEERRRKHSPMKDVAGMVRSFGYATAAALFDTCEPGSDEWRTLEPWADAWETHARDAFLQAYLGRSHERDLLPTDRGEFALLLDFFEIDKALYELDYERSHRPAWVHIPLRGLGRIAAREVA